MSMPGLSPQLLAPRPETAEVALRLARASLEALALKVGQVLDARVLGTSPNGLTQLSIAGQQLSVKLSLPLPAGTQLQLQLQAGAPHGPPVLVAQLPPQPAPAPMTLPATAAQLPLPPPAGAVSTVAAAPPPPSMPGAAPAPSPPGAPVQPAPLPPVTIAAPSPAAAAPAGQPQPPVPAPAAPAPPPPSSAMTATPGPGPVATPAHPTAVPPLSPAPLLLPPAAVASGPAGGANALAPAAPPMAPAAATAPSVPQASAPVAPPVPAAPPPGATAAVATAPAIPAQPNVPAASAAMPQLAAPSPPPSGAPAAPNPAPPAMPTAIAAASPAPAGPTAAPPTAPQPPLAGLPIRPAPLAPSAPPPSGSVAQANLSQATQAAARQDSLAPLLQNLSALAGRSGEFPRPVMEAALRLLAGRLNLDRGAPSGEGLRQAVLRSGIFLEALARPAAPQNPPQADAKAALLALRGALTAWLGEEPAPVAPVARRPPPPTRGAQPRGIRSEPPTLPESAAPRDAGRMLLGQAEAALSRLRLLQLASLPQDGARTAAANPAAPAEWTLEIPLLLGHELALAQLQISRDGGGRDKAERRTRSWRMSFSLNFSALGEVGAQVSLLGQNASVLVWAEAEATAAALAEMLPELTPALMGRGLTVGSVRGRQGRPKAAQPSSGQLLDSLR